MGTGALGRACPVAHPQPGPMPPLPDVSRAAGHRRDPRQSPQGHSPAGGPSAWQEGCAASPPPPRHPQPHRSHPYPPAQRGLGPPVGCRVPWEDRGREPPSKARGAPAAPSPAPRLGSAAKAPARRDGAPRAGGRAGAFGRPSGVRAAALRAHTCAVHVCGAGAQLPTPAPSARPHPCPLLCRPPRMLPGHGEQHPAVPPWVTQPPPRATPVAGTGGWSQALQPCSTCSPAPRHPTRCPHASLHGLARCTALLGPPTHHHQMSFPRHRALSSPSSPVPAREHHSCPCSPHHPVPKQGCRVPRAGTPPGDLPGATSP